MVPRASIALEEMLVSDDEVQGRENRVTEQCAGIASIHRRNDIQHHKSIT
jgi:hypothetical protein